jgi:NAD(P)-dependent dehydrogenase (short-subunit alcohol dehydrogenase family)
MVGRNMNFIRQTVAQNLTGGNAITTKEGNFTHDDVPDQSGKVAVVTGGSEGIGYGVSYTLLAKNISKLFILSPSKEVVEGTTEAIEKDLGANTANKVKWLQCDISDWKAVTEVAKEISNSTDRLDILVNNAGRGIMTQQLDSHGVDRHMSVNHFGHVILVSHLLPLLKRTAEQGHTVRISNQSSNTHQNAPKDQHFKSLDDLNRELGPLGGYGRSKLAVLLYSRFLARHLTSSHPKILVNATHPGVVKTKQSDEDIHEAYPLGGYGMSIAMQPFKKDLFEGALPTLFAVTKTEKSGEYICPPAKSEAGSELGQSQQLQEDLMKLTIRIIKEKTEPDSVAKGCPFSLY